jgi:hypothetical protein
MRRAFSAQVALSIIMRGDSGAGGAVLPQSSIMLQWSKFLFVIPASLVTPRVLRRAYKRRRNFCPPLFFT